MPAPEIGHVSTHWGHGDYLQIWGSGFLQSNVSFRLQSGVYHVNDWISDSAAQRNPSGVIRDYLTNGDGLSSYVYSVGSTVSIPVVNRYADEYAEARMDMYAGVVDGTKAYTTILWVTNVHGTGQPYVINRPKIIGLDTPAVNHLEIKKGFPTKVWGECLRSINSYIMDPTDTAHEILPMVFLQNENDPVGNNLVQCNVYYTEGKYTGQLYDDNHYIPFVVPTGTPNGNYVLHAYNRMGKLGIASLSGVRVVSEFTAPSSIIINAANHGLNEANPDNGQILQGIINSGLTVALAANQWAKAVVKIPAGRYDIGNMIAIPSGVHLLTTQNATLRFKNTYENFVVVASSNQPWPLGWGSHANVGTYNAAIRMYNYAQIEGFKIEANDVYATILLEQLSGISDMVGVTIKDIECVRNKNRNFDGGAYGNNITFVFQNCPTRRLMIENCFYNGTSFAVANVNAWRPDKYQSKYNMLINNTFKPRDWSQPSDFVTDNGIGNLYCFNEINGSRRGFVNPGNQGINDGNIYFRNSITDGGRSYGSSESILMESSTPFFSGQADAVTPSSIKINPPVALASAGLYVGDYIGIVGGKGVGQHVKIVGHDTNGNFQIQGTWRIQPVASSTRVMIGCMKNNNIIADNIISNKAGGIWLYYMCWGNKVIDNDVIDTTSGYFLFGDFEDGNQGIQSSFHNQFIHCEGTQTNFDIGAIREVHADTSGVPVVGLGGSKFFKCAAQCSPISVRNDAYLTNAVNTRYPYQPGYGLYQHGVLGVYLNFEHMSSVNRDTSGKVMFTYKPVTISSGIGGLNIATTILNGRSGVGSGEFLGYVGLEHTDRF